MSGAQGNYNELSGQARYAPGMTATVDVAVQAREDSRSSYTLGSILAFTGAAAVVGAATWMVLAATLSDDPPPATAIKTGAPPKALEPAVQGAAQQLVDAAFRRGR